MRRTNQSWSEFEPVTPNPLSVTVTITLSARSRILCISVKIWRPLKRKCLNTLCCSLLNLFWIFPLKSDRSLCFKNKTTKYFVLTSKTGYVSSINTCVLTTCITINHEIITWRKDKWLRCLKFSHIWWISLLYMYMKNVYEDT